MKSPNISAGRLEKTTAGWVRGANSVRSPWGLPEDQYKWGVNITNRGGVIQTRPGFSMKLSLPPGNFQGGIIFNANKQFSSSETVTLTSGERVQRKASVYTPDGGSIEAFEISYIVFCVDGKVYYSEFPLKQPKSWSDYQLSSISLDPTVNKVNFTIATQSAAISAGNNATITPSHRLIIIQDGVSSPGYWDGSNNTGNVSTVMPVGYWMAYSGNRLWVANGNIISASDLANPLGWDERVSGAGRGDFSVARPVTALQDYVGQNNDTRLYVFTDRATYSLASGVLDRGLWASTPNFQNTLFPTIGCVAGKSIAFQAGQMWWYSQGGLISVDVAASSYLSSQVLYKDVEMAKAKRLMAADYTGICSVAFENYLLCSIPYLETLNSVTMVLDYAAASEWNQAKTPAWAGVWTGIRPVEWTTGVVGNQPRCFAFSVDYASTNDGSHNHLWEAFMPNRYDTYLQINQDSSTEDLINRIYCQFETALLGDQMDLKQLAYGELDCSQIAGTVDVNVSYRGMRGQYQNILSTRLLALTEEYQYQTSQFLDSIADLGILQTQYRRLITQNINRTPKSQSCESTNTLDVDKAFSFLVEWCGAFGLEAIRMYQDPYPTPSVGYINKKETTFCAIGENGQSIEVPINQSPLETSAVEQSSWTSTRTKTVTLPCSNGKPSVSATATASYTSYISLADANDQADTQALNEATNAANQYRKANPC
jgi:hypothetical protein